MEPILDLISSANGRLENSCEEIRQIRDELKVFADEGVEGLTEYVDRLTSILDEIAAWD